MEQQHGGTATRERPGRGGTDRAGGPAPFRRARERGITYWVRPITYALWLAVFAWAARGVAVLLSPEDDPTPNAWFVVLTALLGGVGALAAALRLKDPQERWAVYGSVTFAAAWTSAVWWALLPFEELAYALAFATAVGQALHLANNRGAERHDIDSEIRAWPGLAEGSRWKDTVMTRPRQVFGWGYKLHLRRAKGSDASVKALLHPEARDQIEDILEAPDASATVERDARSKTDVVVTVVLNDPHAEGIRWDGVPAESIADQVTIGKYDDGALERTAWWTPGVGGFHRLMCGITRSGKSTLMKLLACIYGPADDTILWFIDLKGGMSFRRLFPLGDWSARKAADALAMLRTANALIEERTTIAGDVGMDPWVAASPFLPDGTERPVDQGGPVYIVFIDELAKLIGVNAPRWVANESVPLLINIAQQGAGVGVLLCMATQFPTLEALASSQIREQIEWAACFRLRDSGTAHYVLPNASTRVEPANISAERRGTCYVDAQGELRETTLRCLDITTEQVDAVVGTWWTKTPDPPSYDRAVYADDYRGRDIWTPDGVTHVTDPDEEPDVTTDEHLPIPDVPPCPDCLTEPTAHAAAHTGACPGCGRTFAPLERTLLAQAALAAADHDLDLNDDQESPMTATFADLIAADRATTPADELAERDAAAAALRGPTGDTPEDQACLAAWQALVDAGNDGIAPKGVRLAADRGEAWSFRYLSVLREHFNAVERLGYGRYRVTPGTTTAPDMGAVRAVMNPPRTHQEPSS